MSGLDFSVKHSTSSRQMAFIQEQSLIMPRR